MDELFWVKMPRNMVIGVGAIDEVGTITKNIGSKKVLIITDKGVLQAGLIDKVKQSLEKNDINFGIYDKCEPDPPQKIIKDCAQFAKNGFYDLIISVGGGSTIDTGKLAAILATSADIDHEDINQYPITGVPRPGLPKIHIPTTSGSGAEVSWIAVYADMDGNKKYISSDYLLPEVAIIDPLMTLNLPAKITAETGMDALAHAIEGYTNLRANIISDMYAEIAIKLISDNLRSAFYKGSKNLEARYNMALAATIAVKVMDFTSGGIIAHGMGHTLQSFVHISHGASLAILLPYAMEFNMYVNQRKYARIAELMGEKIDGLSLREAASKAVEAVKKLSLDMGLLQRLRDVGIKKEQISLIVDNLFTMNLKSVNSNPRECTRDEAKKIYESAW